MKNCKTVGAALASALFFVKKRGFIIYVGARCNVLLLTIYIKKYWINERYYIDKKILD